MNESSSDSESNNRKSLEAELISLRHEIELLKLKNEMLESSLEQKEAWHQERGEHIKRLIEEKAWLEEQIKGWIQKLNENQIQEALPEKDDWARRKTDVISLEKNLRVDNKQTTQKDEIINPQDIHQEEIEKPIIQDRETQKNEIVDEPITVHKESEPLRPLPVKQTKIVDQTPQAFRKRLLGFVIVTISLLILFVIPNNLRDKILEKEVFAYQSVAPSPKPSDKIKLVLISEQDLAQIGRWPWPRDVIALYHEYLSEKCQVKTIVYDILFVEASDDEADQELIENVNFRDNTLFAAAAKPESLFEIEPTTKPFDLNPVEINSEGLILPMEGLFHPEKIGAVNTNDTERTRKVPLFFNINQVYLPNLSFLAVMKFADVQQRMFDYKYDESLTIKGWENGKDRIIPLYNKNEFLVTPYDDISHFKTYTFSEIFQKIIAEEPIPELKDALVFIGINDGVSDPHTNARGTVVPGVLLHAGLASNIMEDHFIHQLSTKYLCLTLICAIIFSLISAYLCEKVYLIKNLWLQRMLFIVVPLSVLFSLSIIYYSEGGVWRYIACLSFELAFLLPIAIVRWNVIREQFDLYEAVDLTDKNTIHYTILNQSPRPMALAYERYLQVTSDKSHHASTVFEERVVRFLGLVHLATLYRGGGKVDDKFLQLLHNDTQNFERPLAAGTCISFGIYVRKVLKSLDDQRVFKNHDPKAFRESFLKERQSGGHYDIGQESLGKLTFDAWLIQYWSKMRFRLMVYLGHEKKQEKEFLVYEYLGGTQRLGRQTFASDLKLELNHIYLMTREGYLIDLFPFYIYQPYEQSQAKEIFEFYQLLPSNKVAYKTLDGSHSIEIQDQGLNGILNQWTSFKTTIKKELPLLSDFHQSIDDELIPWSVEDRVLDNYVIKKVIMRQHGAYWYEAERLDMTHHKKTKHLLNFYLKGTSAYKNLDLLKLRLGQDLNPEVVLVPEIYCESTRGFWVVYPFGQFVIDQGLVTEDTKLHLRSLLTQFHSSIGPHQLLSARAFVSMYEGQQQKILMTPGLKPKEHGQAGIGLERMMDKLKQKEMKQLNSILS